MTLQINVDPSGLTQSQREALAGFILAYPGKECAGTCGNRHHDDMPDAIREMANFPAIVSTPEKAAVLDPAVTQLAQDDADFDAAQAFGSAPAPLPPGAVAPSTAVVAPLPTAPVATLATTSTTPLPAPPVPAPPTNVAVPVPPAPAAPTNPVDLDKNGLPWDYRIHAESKAKIADGTWRKKRNCDPAHVATVEAELRQLMGAPAVTGVAPSVPLPPPAPAPIPPAPSVSVPASVERATVPTPPAAAQVGSPVDPKAQFVQLVGKAAAAINAGKVTKEQVNACCAAHGVAQLVLLASRLDLVPTVAAEIYKLIGE